MLVESAVPKASLALRISAFVMSSKGDSEGRMKKQRLDYIVQTKRFIQSPANLFEI